MPGNAARRGGFAAASIVALSTASIALGAAGAAAQGPGDDNTFGLVFFGLLLLAVIPITAVTAAASAASNILRALAHTLLAGAVVGALGGLAVHPFFTSEQCTSSLGAFVLGAMLCGSLLGPSILATWAPSILAAISARRFPSRDCADVVQAITAGWAALLLAVLLLPVLALGGLSPWLLPIVAAALVDLVWWRRARARVERRIQTLCDARDGSTPRMTIAPATAAPAGLVPFVRVAPSPDLALYDAALVEASRSPTYRGSELDVAEWLGRVPADGASDGHARATVWNFVIGPVRWFEVAALVVLVVGSLSALVGWVSTDLLTDHSFRSCLGLHW
ncbi:MAG: hypothetical protein NVSMB47_17140 [Polyangiales bacterium]